MHESVSYQGRDLEAMSFAGGYHRWILREFRPYLGARLVEVGAGSGSFSELLIESRPESLALVEPSAEMFPLLEARVEAARACGARITTYNSLFRGVAREIAERERPDSILYVNVLEHVEDDEGELAAVCGALAPGGRAFVFAPALRWLYGDFDRAVGHRRRYTKPELEAKCERAGLRVVASRYFDLLGVAPWWIKYRLLRSSTLEPRAVRLYDRYCVPVARAAESFVRPPAGKNVLLVAEKV